VEIGADGAEAELVPSTFVAVTVNVYSTPLRRPEISQEVDALVQVSPSGDEVTVYRVIERPPSETGAAHETVTELPVAPTPLTELGAPGAPPGMTASDASEAAPAPTMLVAMTVNVYETPLVRPVTVHEVVLLVQVRPPGLDVTV
jgi:hypothetical protein